MDWQTILTQILRPEMIVAIATLVTSFAGLINANLARAKANETNKKVAPMQNKLEEIHGILDGVAKSAQKKAVTKAVRKEKVKEKIRTTKKDIARRQRTRLVKP